MVMVDCCFSILSIIHARSVFLKKEMNLLFRAPRPQNVLINLKNKDKTKCFFLQKPNFVQFYLDYYFLCFSSNAEHSLVIGEKAALFLSIFFCFNYQILWSA